MNSPFDPLLASLPEERDKVEFLKAVNEAGLQSGDIEIAKLFIALQLYKGYYADIPRQIKSVHVDALHEFRRVQEEIASLADRTAADASEIGEKAEEIRSALKVIEPAEVAKLVHKRLLDDTLSAMSGSLRALATASGQIESATRAMDDAGYQAAVAIEVWQKLSLRRVWASAFCCSLIVAFAVLTILWFVFLHHQP